MGADERFLRLAIEISRRCAPTARAFNVGCVIVDAGGEVVATGFSRESNEHIHAEEAALAKIGERDLAGAALYTSLEPCSVRLSGRRSCTSRILATDIGRVVFAMREPDTFVHCTGADDLVRGGVEVLEFAELSCLVAEINRHLT